MEPGSDPWPPHPPAHHSLAPASPCSQTAPGPGSCPLSAAQLLSFPEGPFHHYFCFSSPLLSSWSQTPRNLMSITEHCLEAAGHPLPVTRSEEEKPGGKSTECQSRRWGNWGPGLPGVARLTAAEAGVTEDTTAATSTGHQPPARQHAEN